MQELEALKEEHAIVLCVSASKVQAKGHGEWQCRAVLVGRWQGAPLTSRPRPLRAHFSESKSELLFL